MSDTPNIDPRALTEATLSWVSEHTPYYSPYLCCLCSDTIEHEEFTTTLNQSASSLNIDIDINTQVETNSDEYNLFFFACESDSDEILTLTDLLLEQLQDVHPFISAFRHNSIGEISDTLYWSWIQLAHLCTDGEQDRCFAINDFTNKDSWQGISDYPSFSGDDDFEEDEDEDGSEQDITAESIIDDLENCDFCDTRTLERIHNLCNSSNDTGDIKLWGPDVCQFGFRSTIPAKSVFASIILSYYKNDDNYVHRESLQNYVDEHLYSECFKTVIKECDSSYNITELQEWLESDGSNTKQLKNTVNSLKEHLKLDSHRSSREYIQPEYNVFRRSFMTLLVAAYWRMQSQGGDKAKRLLIVFIELAPQKVIKAFSTLFCVFMGDFKSAQHKLDFLSSLDSLKTPKSDEFVFLMHHNAEENRDEFNENIKHYLSCSQKERDLLDSSIQKLFIEHQQNFYFEVWLTDKSFQAPEHIMWREAFKEVHRYSYKHDEEVLAALFDEDEVFAAGNYNSLFNNFNFDILASEHLSENPSFHGTEKNRLGYSILRKHEDYLELIFEVPGADFKANERLKTSHLVIFNNQVDDKKIDHAISLLPNLYKTEVSTESLIVTQLDNFVSGSISFDEYWNTMQYLVNSDEYALNNELFSEFTPRLLPAIRMEQNKEVQTRLIKAITAHPVRGKRILEEIAFKLFIDDAYQKELISYDMWRKVKPKATNKDVKTLDPALKKEFSKFLATLIKNVNSL